MSIFNYFDKKCCWWGSSTSCRCPDAWYYPQRHDIYLYELDEDGYTMNPTGLNPLFYKYVPDFTPQSIPKGAYDLRYPIVHFNCVNAQKRVSPDVPNGGSGTIDADPPGCPTGPCCSQSGYYGGPDPNNPVEPSIFSGCNSPPRITAITPSHALGVCHYGANQQAADNGHLFKFYGTKGDFQFIKITKFIPIGSSTTCNPPVGDPSKPDGDMGLLEFVAAPENVICTPSTPLSVFNTVLGGIGAKNVDIQFPWFFDRMYYDPTWIDHPGEEIGEKSVGYIFPGLGCPYGGKNGCCKDTCTTIKMKEGDWGRDGNYGPDYLYQECDESCHNVYDCLSPCNTELPTGACCCMINATTWECTNDLTLAQCDATEGCTGTGTPQDFIKWGPNACCAGECPSPMGNNAEWVCGYAAPDDDIGGHWDCDIKPPNTSNQTRYWKQFDDGVGSTSTDIARVINVYNHFDDSSSSEGAFDAEVIPCESTCECSSIGGCLTGGGMCIASTEKTCLLEGNEWFDTMFECDLETCECGAEPGRCCIEYHSNKPSECLHLDETACHCLECNLGACCCNTNLQNWECTNGLTSTQCFGLTTCNGQSNEPIVWHDSKCCSGTPDCACGYCDGESCCANSCNSFMGSPDGRGCQCDPNVKNAYYKSSPADCRESCCGCEKEEFCCYEGQCILVSDADECAGIGDGSGVHHETQLECTTICCGCCGDCNDCFYVKVTQKEWGNAGNTPIEIIDNGTTCSSSLTAINFSGGWSSWDPPIGPTQFPYPWPINKPYINFVNEEMVGYNLDQDNRVAVMGLEVKRSWSGTFHGNNPYNAGIMKKGLHTGTENCDCCYVNDPVEGMNATNLECLKNMTQQSCDCFPCCPVEYDPDHPLAPKCDCTNKCEICNLPNFDCDSAPWGNIFVENGLCPNPTEYLIEKGLAERFDMGSGTIPGDSSSPFFSHLPQITGKSPILCSMLSGGEGLLNQVHDFVIPHIKEYDKKNGTNHATELGFRIVKEEHIIPLVRNKSSKPHGWRRPPGRLSGRRRRLEAANNELVLRRRVEKRESTEPNKKKESKSSLNKRIPRRTSRNLKSNWRWGKRKG